MTRPLVERMIAKSPAHPERALGTHLNVNDKLRVFWYRSQGMGAQVIQKQMRIGRNTVYRLLHQTFVNPSVMLTLPGVYEDLGDEYRCGFCPERTKQERRMQRHVLAHVLPFERARDVNLEALAGRRL